MHILFRHLSRLDFRAFAESLVFGKFSRQVGEGMSALRQRRDGARAPTEHVLLACHPRGGSTWLAELLWETLPDYQLVFEPFNPDTNKEARADFRYHNYFREHGDKFNEKRAKQILKGNFLATGYLMHHGTIEGLWNLVRAKNLVFKCTRANMMVHRLVDAVPVKVVLLLRHPCAVVASQMNHDTWKNMTEKEPEFEKGLGKVLADFPEWKSVWSRINTQEELLAFIWGARTAIPLKRPELKHWHVMSYEGLVSNPDVELNRLFDYIGHPVPQKASELINRPSSTVRAGSNVAKGENPLTTWRHRLHADQIDRILSITREMGISCYNEELMPFPDEGSLEFVTGPSS